MYNGLTEEIIPFNLKVSEKPVGKEGLLDVIEDVALYPETVERYFQRLPTRIDSEVTSVLTLDQDEHLCRLHLEIECGLYINAQ